MPELYYEVHEGNGPPLLMVHGLLSSRAQWANNLEALRQVATPVVVEMFGHGRSPAPLDSACYLPGAYLQEFEAIRVALGCESWYLLGYSLGAGLTIRYALTFPERVLAHVCTNSNSAFLDTTTVTPPDPEALVARFEREGHSAIDAIPVHPRFARRLPESIKTPLLEDAQLLDPGGVGRTIAYTNGHASIRDELHLNQRPALLVCGRYETRFQSKRDFAAANMPGLTVVDLEAGHAVNAEDSPGFNNAVTDFLRQHQRL